MRVIVDAHLDIAWNALAHDRGFDQAPPRGYMVSRATLVAAGVGLVFPTLFSMRHGGLPGEEDSPLAYRTPGEAFIFARAQLGYYRSVGLRLITSRQELAAYARSWRPGMLAGVLLMESADAIVSPRQLKAWAELGLRVVGPAWMGTRYCGGSHMPGGLTDPGRDLLRAMSRHRMILDLSHMADRSMREAFEAWRGPTISTHAGARALNAGQRQLPDWAIAEVGRRDGIVGVSFFQGHLRATGRATPADVARHALHYARVSGDVRHVGLGTDLDGGFGADRAPIRSLAGHAQVRTALARHFAPADVEGIMGANWIRFLATALPDGRSSSAANGTPNLNR